MPLISMDVLILFEKSEFKGRSGIEEPGPFCLGIRRTKRRVYLPGPGKDLFELVVRSPEEDALVMFPEAHPVEKVCEKEVAFATKPGTSIEQLKDRA
jgi:hypothetical protein